MCYRGRERSMLKKIQEANRQNTSIWRTISVLWQHKQKQKERHLQILTMHGIKKHTANKQANRETLHVLTKLKHKRNKTDNHASNSWKANVRCIANISKNIRMLNLHLHHIYLRHICVVKVANVSINVLASTLCLVVRPQATHYAMWRTSKTPLGLKANKTVARREQHNQSERYISLHLPGAFVRGVPTDQIMIVTECVHDSLALHCAWGSMWAEVAGPTPL